MKSGNIDQTYRAQTDQLKKHEQRPLKNKKKHIFPDKSFGKKRPLWEAGGQKKRVFEKHKQKQHKSEKEIYSIFSR